MPDQQLNIPGVEQPAGDSAPLSFRDRKMASLGEENRLGNANFDGPPSNLKQVELPEQEVQQDAHQPDEGLPEESLNEEERPPEEQPEEGVEDSNVESVIEEEMEIPELRQRAEEAEARVQSMQRDYTQKTQKLGETRKELLDNLDQSRRVAAVYAERAGQHLKRYEQVDWQQLQSTLDPQTFQTRQREYQNAVRMRDQAAQEHQMIENFANQQVEKARESQAEISRDILRSTIPGWGDDLYGTLRTFAVEKMGFTADEYNDITDHRIISLIHTGWKVSDAGRTIQNIQQQGNQSRGPASPNKDRPRGRDGKYRRAQQEHERRPGDRGATRAAFGERLRQERESGRR